MMLFDLVFGYVLVLLRFFFVILLIVLKICVV